MTISGIIFDMGHTLMGQDEPWDLIEKQGATDLAEFLHGQGAMGKSPEVVASFLENRRRHFVDAKADHKEVPAIVSLKQALSDHGFNDLTDVFCQKALSVFFQYEMTKWYPFPNSRRILKQLAGNGIRAGIYSNASDDEYIHQLVDDFGFRPFVSPVLTSAGTGIRKPDARGFEPFLEEWSVAADSVVMIGDRLDVDILGGKNAGMKTILFQLESAMLEIRDIFANETDVVQVQPDATIKDLRELPYCLNSLY